MELTIQVICEDLPGALPADTPAARGHIYLGLQRDEEMIAAVPAQRGRAVFEPNFRVQPLSADKANFLGPFAKGTPAERFFYLVWAAQGEDGTWTRIGRAKVHLNHLRWAEVEESVRSAKPLSVTLSLTDGKGRPRCGSIRDARWQQA